MNEKEVKTKEGEKPSVEEIEKTVSTEDFLELLIDASFSKWGVIL